MVPAARTMLSVLDVASSGRERSKTGAFALTEITMSNPHRSHLPPEILDCIVDLLHDKPEALKLCCLVSKSLVPRTRTYLFASIRFQHPDDLRLWKKAFPDPANSPAFLTHTLSIFCPQVVMTADAEEGGLVRMFPRVVRLAVFNSPTNPYKLEVSLAPFHSFSPVLKSLRVISYSIPHSQILNLICSLHLLEDLCVIDYGRNNCDLDGTIFQRFNP